ncbi:TlpA disulfide reductase family protein [Pseudomonas sp. TTU2014-080ASC]|uniref:TlpA disulfide reductase family protein n=1 Tax=Pseudomonas sp. TTU2014-080ASC TaxID=1729724 RepID=UPI0007183491|nr:TlpA disulfide reductase family protein [Pseudomonas sp. TTU2014-080ASC]KRW59666.1 peroxiredoxin [Pseudomonas sp. TTU2014-080ASC]
MRAEIKKVGRLLAGLFLGLVLVGCSQDYGLDQHGRSIPAKELDGKWLVINYWAQWCAPCRTEIPELNSLDQQSEGRQFAVLGVNFDGLHGAKLEEASAEMGVAFRVLANDPAERFKLPRAEVLPVTYIVDADGQIRDRLVGEQTAAGLSTRLSELMDEE